MLVRFMFNKRIILLIIGIFVAIAICLSTSLFGMKIAYIKILNPKVLMLKSHSDLVFVADRNIDWKSVIAEF
jgi:ABC-type enterochelin transport system permease subunit